jgi:hypothetical protein
MTRVDELRNRIKVARAGLANECKGSSTPELGMVARTSRHQAEIVAAAAELNEISTGRVVALTRWLVVLTGALLLLTFVLAGFTVALYKDTHFQIEREKKQQHAKLQQLSKPRGM